LVFSVAVLSVLAQDTAVANTDLANPHDLPSIDQTMLFAEDAAPLAHAPVETADIFPATQPHFDFLLT